MKGEAVTMKQLGLVTCMFGIVFAPRRALFGL